MEKAYFRERTEAQIRNELQIIESSDNLVNRILNLNPSSDGIVIQLPLIPATYSARKFMKHGAEIKLPRFQSILHSARYGKTPVQLRWQAFDDLKPGTYCAYSFKPFTGTDTRTRRVSLVECLEGAQLYCYSHQENVPINVNPYDNAKSVAKEGAEVIVEVPSRTDKRPRIQFKFSSIPVLDSSRKLAIAMAISSDHACNKKRFDIRYKYFDDKESSRVFNFCAHEVAGYLELIDHYMTEEKNIIPLQMSQFAIPTQFTVDFFKKLGNNCVMQTRAQDSDKGQKKLTRKLNDAEKEILLWALVQKEGHDQTFFASDKKVRDYDWKF